MDIDDLFAGPHPWEPHYFDLDAHLSHVHWTTARTGLLQSVLVKARAGQLETGWRAALEHPERISTPEQRRLDTDKVALQEIKELTIARWEPGVATSWRQALDSWFYAIREVVMESMMLWEEMDRVTRQARHRLLMSSLGSDLDHFYTDLVDKIISREPEFDDGAYGAISRGVIERDRITASYLAGRAAGGEDTDWVNWFRSRISRWRKSDPAAQWHAAAINRPEYRAKLQQLPTYWTG
jgi:hypothetical protein